MVELVDYPREGIMQLKLALSFFGLAVTSIIMAGLCGPAYAGGYCRHCSPCPNGINGEIFGYFPTVWRAWPVIATNPMQDASPAPGSPSAPLPTAPAKQPTPSPKAPDKALQQSSLRIQERQGPKVDQQQYYAPPQ
jgi:hypothetical protein